ncbi:MAG: DUF3139 domain-containing protein [Staphylococcus sp.]|nr:DUF3139 domain-containing protein [Staphylococcus sp.]
MKKVFYSIGIIIVLVICYIFVNFFFFDSWACHSSEKQLNNYVKHEEAKLKQKVHHIFKQKGWEDKVKEEKNIFTFNTGDNDLQVTFKDEPYNTYTYSIDENNKVYGHAVLKDEYDKDFDSKKKYKEYLRKMRFEEKYDLK